MVIVTVRAFVDFETVFDGAAVNKTIDLIKNDRANGDVGSFGRNKVNEVLYK